MKYFSLLLVLFTGLLSFGQNSYCGSCSSFFSGNEFWENRIHNIHEESVSLAKEKYKKVYGKKIFNGLKSHYDKRLLTLSSLIEKGDLIVDGELYEYVEGVLQNILNCSGVDKDVYLFLVKDDSPNAFNMGDDHLFVHLGLLKRITCEDQLAFVLAHELGHNELEHFRQRTEEYLILNTNDSIQNRIKEIKKSNYRYVSALNELLVPWILATRENSRLNEFDADRFGFNSIKACGYDVTKAAGVFDIIEQVDSEDSSQKNISVLLRLDDIEMDFSRALEGKTESSLGLAPINSLSDTMTDMLRTHPFGDARKKAVIPENNKNTYGHDSIDPSISDYRSLAYKEIIIDNLYDDEVDYAIYMCLEILESDEQDDFIHMVIPFSFAYLGHQKIKRRVGRNVRLQSVYYGESFNQLVYFLRELSPEQCFAIAEKWCEFNQENNTIGLSNPSLAIMDLIEENHEGFNERLAIEKEKGNPYFTISILEKLKSQLN